MSDGSLVGVRIASTKTNGPQCRGQGAANDEENRERAANATGEWRGPAAGAPAEPDARRDDDDAPALARVGPCAWAGRAGRIVSRRGRGSRKSAVSRRVVARIGFFFNDTATTEIYALALHDALPISIFILKMRWRFCSRRRWASARSRSMSPLASVQARGRLSRCLPDRKSTRLNSSHSQISYAVFCLKKKNQEHELTALN